MKQFILTILLIAGTIFTTMYLTQTKPEPKKKQRKTMLPVVEVSKPNAQSYNIAIHTSGTVEAHSKTSIVSEIAGKVAYISKKFNEGEYFNKDTTLIKLDDKNYRNSIAIAQADIKQKQLALQDSKNQIALSADQWKLHSKTRQDSELATLKIKSATSQSALEAAKLRLQKAQTDRENAIIQSPYAGRVLSRDVGIGQYVGPGEKLGTVYSTDYVEVRLPLTLEQYESLNLPENYRNAKSEKTAKLPDVIFYSQSLGKKKQWKGKVVRSSPAMDERTRQISVIARIDDPFKRPADGGSVVKIGQFLQAKIQTKQLNNVFILPSQAIRQQKELLLFDKGSIIVKDIKVLHIEGNNVVISADDLPTNATVITTPMASAKTGMKVRLFNQKENKKDRQKHKPDSDALQTSPEGEPPSENNSKRELNDA